eukprot:455639_1
MSSGKKSYRFGDITKGIIGKETYEFGDITKNVAHSIKSSTLSIANIPKQSTTTQTNIKDLQLQIKALKAENDILRQENAMLKQSKVELVQSTSKEINRLQNLLNDGTNKHKTDNNTHKINIMNLLIKDSYDQKQNNETSNEKLFKTKTKTKVKSDSVGTYFRVNEWMTVNVAKIFGKQLNEVPWYRFPYWAFIGLYWKIMWKEFKTSVKYEGLIKTLSSSGFTMDVVIGAVFSLFFAQFGALSLPLRLMYGEQYDEMETETLNIESTKIINWRQDVNDRIQVSSQRNVGNKYKYSLVIPRHKPFTEILIKAATNYWNVIQLNDISGNTDYIQMELMIHNNTQNVLTWIQNNIKNKVVLQDFSYPTDEVNSKRVLLLIKIPTLMRAIAKLNQHSNIEILQIYDFV